MRKTIVLGFVLGGIYMMNQPLLGQNELEDPGLVACWTFKEGSGDIAKDVTDNNNNGILKNGPTWVKDGIDGALKFDGVDDYVDCGHGTILDSITNQITLAAWVYPEEAGRGESMIVGKSTGTYALEFGREGIIFYISGGEKRCDASIPAKEWSHVVGTYDGEKMRLYINGQQDSICTLQNVPIKTSGESVIIGKQREVYFKGMIDNVKIYNRSLSEKEIKEHYASGQKSIKQPEAVKREALKRLALKVYDVGSKSETVLVAEESIEGDLCIPSNICLKFVMGSILNIKEGVTLTIRGPMEAPLTQIFSGSGKVVLEPGHIKETYPQWWGAKADGKNDDTAAIQSAINSDGGRVFMPRGTYRVSSTIKIPGGTILVGARARLRGMVPVMLQSTDPNIRTSGWRITGLTLEGIDRASSKVGIDFTKNSYSIMEDVSVVGFEKGILMDGGNEACMYNSFNNISVARCGTAIELNNSTIETKIFGCIIGAVNTGILVNTANELDIYSTSIEVFKTGIHVKRGDTVHMNYIYFASGTTGIEIDKGVTACTILNPRYSQVPNEIIDHGAKTVILAPLVKLVQTNQTSNP